MNEQLFRKKSIDRVSSPEQLNEYIRVANPGRTQLLFFMHGETAHRRLSWYEQKAVCILLTLLHLGIKNIRLGPTLPAFISPNVLSFLVEKFNIALITTPEEDLKAILGK